MALVIGGYLSATIATTIGGPAMRRSRRPLSPGVAVIGSLVTDLVAGPRHREPSQPRVLRALGALCIRDARGGVGRGGASGAVRRGRDADRDRRLRHLRRARRRGVGAEAVLPNFWGTIGPYLPTGAGTTAVRNTIYFGGNGIGARSSCSPSISSSAPSSRRVPRPRRRTPPAMSSRPQQPQPSSEWAWACSRLSSSASLTRSERAHRVLRSATQPSSIVRRSACPRRRHASVDAVFETAHRDVEVGGGSWRGRSHIVFHPLLPLALVLVAGLASRPMRRPKSPAAAARSPPRRPRHKSVAGAANSSPRWYASPIGIPAR